MWERYCRGVQAIVFVIDAADADLLEQARSELQSLLQKPSLQEIPLLVLGNKNDIAGALSTGELIDRLHLKVSCPLRRSATTYSRWKFLSLEDQLESYGFLHN